MIYVPLTIGEIAVLAPMIRERRRLLAKVPNKYTEAETELLDDIERKLGLGGAV